MRLDLLDGSLTVSLDGEDLDVRPAEGLEVNRDSVGPPR